MWAVAVAAEEEMAASVMAHLLSTTRHSLRHRNHWALHKGVAPVEKALHIRVHCLRLQYVDLDSP